MSSARFAVRPTRGWPSRSPADGTPWAASSSRGRPAPRHPRLDRVLGFDRGGTVDVEAGIQWPRGDRRSPSAARRARRLGHRPEADRRRPAPPRRGAGGQRPRPRPARCSRSSTTSSRSRWSTPTASRVRAAATENAELFWLAVGGYGLFGVIAAGCDCGRAQASSASVEVLDDRRPAPAFDEPHRATATCTATSSSRSTPRADDFLRRGVFSCYRPVERASARSRPSSGRSRETTGSA